MRNIFFTADTHFGHRNIIKYCNRPFIDHAITDPENPERYKVEDMDETLIERWNQRVQDTDTVYHLGDFCFGGATKWHNYRQRLNGRIELILGNHDKKILADPVMNDVSLYQEISIDGNSIVLFHYGMRTWHHDLRGTWHLYGHSHGQLPAYGKSFDIGVDNTDFYPLEFLEVKALMDKRDIGEHPMFNDFKAEIKAAQ